MLKLSLVKIYLLLLFIFMILMYIFNSIRIVNYFIYLIIPIIPIVASYKAYHSYGLDNQHAKAIRYLYIGFIFIFLAELVTAILKYVYDIKIHPAPSDIFFTIGILFFFTGILLELRNYRIQLKLWQTISLVIFAIVGLLLVIYFISLPEYNLWQNIVNIFFRYVQFLFLIMIILIFKMTYEFKNGSIFYPWLYVVIGALFNFIGGILLGIFHTQFKGGQFFYVLLIDMTWALAYLFLAYGFYALADTIENIKQKTQIKFNIFKIK